MPADEHFGVRNDGVHLDANPPNLIGGCVLDSTLRQAAQCAREFVHGGHELALVPPSEHT